MIAHVSPSIRLLGGVLFLPLLFAASCGGPSGPVTETGSLEVGDMTLPSGEYQDTYKVRLKTDQWIDVDLRANGFDPYLIIGAPSGTQSDMDDSVAGDTTMTHMTMKAQEDGEYTVVVTSYAPGESGSYTLKYEVSDTQPPGTTPSGGDSGAPAAPAPSTTEPETESI
jgi:hypothetical protein